MDGAMLQVVRALDARRAIEAERYQVGACPVCGDLIDDLTMAEGFTYCAGDVCDEAAAASGDDVL